MIKIRTIFYLLLGGLISLSFRYLDLSKREALIYAIFVGAVAGILSTYIF